MYCIGIKRLPVHVLRFLGESLNLKLIQRDIFYCTIVLTKVFYRGLNNRKPICKYTKDL